jgi:hypothetical protein
VDEDHIQTYEVHDSRTTAVEAMRALQADGWIVYPETVPLQGQAGFYCVLHEKAKDKSVVKRAHSILWNMYEHELVPVEIDCTGTPHLFSFVFEHGKHETFGYFQYPDDDVGFVCYCKGPARGISLVLKISDETQCELSEEAYEFLWMYEKEM